MKAQTPPSRPLSIYIVAAEASGDALGAALARALVNGEAGAVRLSGVGGHAMAAAGIVSPFSIDELSIIGLTAIPKRLPKIFRRIRETALAAVAARPDVLVIIDSPDFTHRIARRVRRLAPNIPIVDYVSPSVWAWRPGRARAMRTYVDQVLAILPFEPAIHVALGGPPCTYVGHPLIERIGELRPNADEARRRLADPPVLLALPGSRPNEIRVSPVFSAHRSSVSPNASGRSISSSRRFRTSPRSCGKPSPVGLCSRVSWSSRARNGPRFAMPARHLRLRVRSLSNLRSPASRWSRPTVCTPSRR